MSSRFFGRDRRSLGEGSGSNGGDGLGEWWAALGVIALVSVAIVSLAGVSDSGPRTPVSAVPGILDSLNPAQRSLEAVESGFQSLCREPVLLALELEPDCESGVITLSDDLFEGYGRAQLGPVAQEDLAAAITTYLAQLRQMPAIWERLEAIEIRGHTDPRAVRNPYATNLVSSQQRALGVLLFLVGSDDVSKADQLELQRLAVVSGVSFSRPPAACPERSSECYAQWRRVEIRPVLSETLRRDDWSRTLQSVRDAAILARREN